jgi:hypothetical protein
MRPSHFQIVLSVVVGVWPASSAFSANVMFLMADELGPTEGDEVQLEIFQERGDFVDIWDNGRLQAEAADALDAADEADLVYIDESVGSSNADPIIETTTPTLNNEQFAFDNWFMTEAPTEHGSPDTPDLFGGSHVGTEIQIVDDQHPIARAAGVINGIVQVYDDDGRIDWGFPGPQADIVAIVPGFEDFDPAATIFVYEQGAELIDGTPAPGMRIGFFISDTDGGGTGREATLLTDAGKALLNATIDYALGISVGVDPKLQAGDADQDLDFDQLDLVKVQIAGKYLTGQAATWGDGDWNGAPGGSQGNPPAGDGRFDQLDIIQALAPGLYLTGPYAAISGGGQRGDVQTSVIYDAASGEVSVDAPAGTELTSINIDSAAGIFTADPAQNLGGSFDNDADGNIFKATFGGSFGSVSFGNVAQTGLSEEFMLGDLTVVGSLAGGGDLGNVDLIYVPEPATFLMLVLGLLAGLRLRRQR